MFYLAVSSGTVSSDTDSHRTVRNRRSGRCRSPSASRIGTITVLALALLYYVDAVLNISSFLLLCNQYCNNLTGYRLLNASFMRDAVVKRNALAIAFALIGSVAI